MLKRRRLLISTSVNWWPCGRIYVIWNWGLNYINSCGNDKEINTKEKEREIFVEIVNLKFLNSLETELLVWTLTLSYSSAKLFPGARDASRKSARDVVSHKRSNKASHPRTFDVEIQFPSRGSRDVSRPFPSLRSPPFCFFRVCSSPAICPFSRGSYLAQETRNAETGDFYHFFLSHAKGNKKSAKGEPESVSSSLCEYIAPGDHRFLEKTVVAANSHAKIYAKW